MSQGKRLQPERALQVHYVGELNTFPGWDS